MPAASKAWELVRLVHFDSQPPLRGSKMKRRFRFLQGKIESGAPSGVAQRSLLDVGLLKELK